MKTRPEGLSEGEVAAGVSGGWTVEVADLSYLPEGFGSFHWVATDPSGCRWVITVDDLVAKDWLGGTPDQVFDGLNSAFEVAAALREQAGLDWVVAPVRDRAGAVIRRLGRRFSLALFPYIEASQPPSFDRQTGPGERAQVVGMLAELHAAAPLVSAASRRDPALPNAASLQRALLDLDQPWHGGPYSESSRALLADAAENVTAAIDLFNRLAVGVAGAELVLTHGEPHAGNLIRAGDGRLLLLDWDTVGMAPPERDLWMVLGESWAELDLYRDLTGRAANRSLLDLYRLRWDLYDIASFTTLLREAHDDNEDTQIAWAALQRYTEGLEHWSHVDSSPGQAP